MIKSSTYQDERRTHTHTVITGGVTEDELITGDVRTLSIVLNDKGVPALPSRNGNVKAFRPVTATVRWERGQHWGHSYWGNDSWAYGRDSHTEDWALTTATVRGINVRKNGTDGEIECAAGFANQADRSRWPAWLAEVADAHDPAVLPTKLPAVS